MGICDSSKNPNSSKYTNDNDNQEELGYIFDYKTETNAIKKLNLKFVFYNFKIKYCISHKETRDSTYVTEIIIGGKIFPLIINKGQSPNIPNMNDIHNGYFIENQYSIKDLENLYFLINVYELDEPIEPLPQTPTESFSNELKQKCTHYSYFRINLVSFLFKSMRCDFPMMGDNQLSTKTRISFVCFIEHKEKVIINAGEINNSHIYRLSYKSKNNDITSTKLKSANFFQLTTPPITMQELQRSDLFLETQESPTYYEYFSLNILKALIIRQVGINKMSSNNMSINNNLHNPIDVNNSIYLYENANNPITRIGCCGLISEGNKKINYIEYEAKNKNLILKLGMLPVVTQLSTLYFTEIGNIYSTASLNLVNEDEDLHKYRKSKNISSDNFYTKLYDYYRGISNDKFNSDVLNEIHILLMRSIDTDKFMFIYPSIDKLFEMVTLLMKVGIRIIQLILTTKDDYKLILLTKLINILMKRE